MEPDPASQVERIVASTGELPAIPLVAQKVMAMVAEETTTPADLQRVIGADPALAAKILKVSNSALFSRVRAVTALSHAVLILGYSTIRSLVIATSMRSLFVNRSGEHGLKEQLLWEHSLGCAIAARQISERIGYHGMEGTFVGGLIHDIGKVVLNANLPDVYGDIFQTAYNEERPMREIEAERLGFTHAQVGQLVLRRWNFSAELQEIVAHHHTPREAEVEPFGTALVHIANLLCERLGLGCRPNPGLDIAADESMGVIGLPAQDLDRIGERVRELFQQEKGLFEP